MNVYIYVDDDKEAIHLRVSQGIAWEELEERKRREKWCNYNSKNFFKLKR